MYRWTWGRDEWRIFFLGNHDTHPPGRRQRRRLQRFLRRRQLRCQWGYVVNGSTPLVIAGGGGGGGGNGFGGSGGPGLTSITGGGNPPGSVGGGGLGSGNTYGGGGGGYSGDGGGGSEGGQSFINGGGGGAAYGGLGMRGGYGGGGGGGGACSGGGGGYSGGNYDGGGGGSIIDSSAIQSVTQLAGVRSGNGEIDIVSVSVAVPPAVGITTVSSLPVVVWPTSGTNFVLQMATNLTSGNWVTVTNPKFQRQNARPPCSTH
ncbi:MAG: hypothetical protein WCK89_20030 [bacterium]